MNIDESFEIKPDRYSCVFIKPKIYASLTNEQLASRLSASLTRWQEQGVRGVWAHVDLIHSQFIPVFVDAGFDCHHAQSSYVLMKKWISETEPDTLPPYASQYLGVGGFVVNDNNELLVVQERFRSKSHWKLPGGYAIQGENIGETAIREVLEETGIHTEFQCVVAFRHQHKFQFGCSDLYFVCLLKPLTQDVKRCQHEIKDVRWMNLETYLNHPDVSTGNRHFARCYLDMVANGDQRIQPAKVTNYTNTGYDLIYSIQNLRPDSSSDDAESAT